MPNHPNKLNLLTGKCCQKDCKAKAQGYINNKKYCKYHYMMKMYKNKSKSYQERKNAN